MSTETNVGGRDRLFRAALAVVLSVVALRLFTAGKRKTASVAVVGAVGFGFNAVACFCGLDELLGIDTAD